MNGSLLNQPVTALDRLSRLEHALARRRAFLREIITSLGGDADAAARVVHHVSEDQGLSLDVELLLEDLDG